MVRFFSVLFLLAVVMPLSTVFADPVSDATNPHHYAESGYMTGLLNSQAVAATDSVKKAQALIPEMDAAQRDLERSRQIPLSPIPADRVLERVDSTKSHTLSDSAKADAVKPVSKGMEAASALASFVMILVFILGVLAIITGIGVAIDAKDVSFLLVTLCGLVTVAMIFSLPRSQNVVWFVHSIVAQRAFLASAIVGVAVIITAIVALKNESGAAVVTMVVTWLFMILLLIAAQVIDRTTPKNQIWRSLPQTANVSSQTDSTATDSTKTMVGPDIAKSGNVITVDSVAVADRPDTSKAYALECGLDKYVVNHWLEEVFQTRTRMYYWGRASLVDSLSYPNWSEIYFNQGEYRDRLYKLVDRDWPTGPFWWQAEVKVAIAEQPKYGAAIEYRLDYPWTQFRKDLVYRVSSDGKQTVIEITQGDYYPPRFGSFGWLLGIGVVVLAVCALLGYLSVRGISWLTLRVAVWIWGPGAMNNPSIRKVVYIFLLPGWLGLMLGILYVIFR